VGDSWVFFLGGAPCCGKSSVAAALAEWYGLAHYQIDIRMGDVMSKLDPERYPNLVRWWGMDSDVRWLQSQEHLMQEVLNCYHEQFCWVMADIASCAGETPMLVEGSSLLPEWLAGEMERLDGAAWMVPEEAFQRQRYGERDWVWPFLGDCRDGAQAFENWMRRDAAYAKLVTEQTEALGMPLLVVDRRLSIDDAAAWVAAQLGLDEGAAGGA